MAAKAAAAPAAKKASEARRLGKVAIPGGRNAYLISEADPETGTAVVHARCADLLDEWLDRQRITPEQHQVGRDFQRKFHEAGLAERYKSCLEITNTNARGQGGGDTMARGADALQFVRRCLEALGNDQRSIVINVLGYDWSLTKCRDHLAWAGKFTSPHVIAGILQAALETLGRVMARPRERATIVFTRSAP